MYRGIWSRSNFEQEISVFSVRLARDWMRYSESDCSVTRIARLNAILGKWLQCYQNHATVCEDFTSKYWNSCELWYLRVLHRCQSVHLVKKWTKKHVKKFYSHSLQNYSVSFKWMFVHKKWVGFQAINAQTFIFYYF